MKDRRLEEILFGTGMGHGIDVIRFLTQTEGLPLAITSKHMKTALNKTKHHLHTIYYVYINPKIHINAKYFADFYSVFTDEKAIEIALNDAIGVKLFPYIGMFYSPKRRCIISKEPLKDLDHIIHFVNNSRHLKTVK